MIFNLKSKHDRRDFKRYCNEVYLWGVEKGGVVEVIKKHRQRTLQQNAYCHLCIAYFAQDYGISLEEAKWEFFKKRYNPEIFIKKKVNRKGQEITYIRSTTSLDKAEMTRAIESFKNKVADEYGLIIPEPDEYDALIEAQKQIEKFKEFL